MNEPAPDVALLTPVPLLHLQSGLEVCRQEGRVAFGSESGLVLSEAVAEAREGPLDVYIYASFGAGGPPAISWKARLLSYEGATAFLRGGGAKFRPLSTGDDGKWDAFYLVENLVELPSNKRRLISSLKKRKGGNFAVTFVPHGPVLIENPS